MDKLDKVKEVIEFYYVPCGLFFTRNSCGDPMETIYCDEDITIDICHYWEYFEIFGLTYREQKEIKKFYNSLREKNKWTN